MPEDAEVHELAPLVRPERPVAVTVLDGGQRHPGAVTSWRADWVLAEYTTAPGLKYLRWLPADRVRRLAADDEPAG